jgi:ribokinase
MTARVIVVGSLNMDLVVRAPRIPQVGETLIGSQFQTVPGGKGANQAVAAARLGAHVSLVGRVGRDAFGAALLENLTTDGIDHTFVIQDPAGATGVALIVVDDAGQNSIVVASGANMRLSPGDVEAASAAIASADVVLMQLESPLESVTRAAEIAQARGVPVILNPAPARPLPSTLLSLVDVLIPNESETALLTEMPTDGQVDAQAAAAALRALGVGTVILTLGNRGALLAQATGTIHVPTFRVTPVDTTAAGDAFVGGFAVALAEGRSWREAVRWGNAAGALATTTMGAQPSLPTRRAVETLLAVNVRR